MKKEIGRILCLATSLTLALTAFAGCNTGVTMPFTEMTMPPMGTTTDAEDAEEETTTDADPVATDTTAPSEISDSGNIGDLYYQIVSATSDGAVSERGYYVFENNESKLPYTIYIAAGEFSTGGYDIEIVDVQYDGSELVIVVKETSPGPMDSVTEAFTYPSCTISLSMLPESVKVIDLSGDEFQCLGSQAADAEIEDGWIAVLSDGAGEVIFETYVYETDDGYRYVNVTATTISWGSAKWDRVINGSGNADTRDDVVTAATEHGSAGFVRLPDDDTVYSIDDFISGDIF